MGGKKTKKKKKEKEKKEREKKETKFGNNWKISSFSFMILSGGVGVKKR